MTVWATESWGLVWALVVAAAVLTVVGIVLLRRQ